MSDAIEVEKYNHNDVSDSLLTTTTGLEVSPEDRAPLGPLPTSKFDDCAPTVFTARRIKSFLCVGRVNIVGSDKKTGGSASPMKVTDVMFALFITGAPSRWNFRSQTYVSPSLAMAARSARQVSDRK